MWKSFSYSCNQLSAVVILVSKLSLAINQLSSVTLKDPVNNPHYHVPLVDVILLLMICRPSGCTVVSGVVVVVCNRSQMRTSNCTFNFWCEYRSWPWLQAQKRIFDKSKFKVTRDISPTISGWLLVSLLLFFIANLLWLSPAVEWCSWGLHLLSTSPCAAGEYVVESDLRPTDSPSTTNNQISM